MKVILILEDEYLEVIANKADMDKAMDIKLAERGYDSDDVISIQVVEE